MGFPSSDYVNLVQRRQQLVRDWSPPQHKIEFAIGAHHLDAMKNGTARMDLLVWPTRHGARQWTRVQSFVEPWQWMHAGIDREALAGSARACIVDASLQDWAALPGDCQAHASSSTSSEVLDAEISLCDWVALNDWLQSPTGAGADVAERLPPHPSRVRMNRMQLHHLRVRRALCVLDQVLAAGTCALVFSTARRSPFDEAAGQASGPLLGSLDLAFALHLPTGRRLSTQSCDDPGGWLN